MSTQNKNNGKGFVSKLVDKVKKPPCHMGNTLAFAADGVTVFGGGWSKWADPSAVNITFELRTYNSISDGWKMPTGWTSAARVPLIIPMPIKDGDAPEMVGPTFWYALWDDLKAEAKQEHGNVLVMCQGGHGRTGTVLTCLALAAGLWWDGDPVLELRKQYCDQAVETKDQLDYIERTFGVKTEVKPRWVAGTDSYTAPKVVTGAPATSYKGGDLTKEQEDALNDEDWKEYYETYLSNIHS